jgi:hypothetical protein
MYPSRNHAPHKACTTLFWFKKAASRRLGVFASVVVHPSYSANSLLENTGNRQSDFTVAAQSRNFTVFPLI